MKLPLKTNVFIYAMNHSPFTMEQLMEGLAVEHGGERQFKIGLIEKYLISYCGVNVIAPVIGADGKAEPGTLKFTVTEYGSQNMKYIPKA